MVSGQNKAIWRAERKTNILLLHQTDDVLRTLLLSQCHYGPGLPAAKGQHAEVAVKMVTSVIVLCYNHFIATSLTPEELQFDRFLH